jgi:hypothetical protein
MDCGARYSHCNVGVDAAYLAPDITTTQAAVWLDQRFFRGKPIYNTGQVLTIRGNLRVDIFERALHEVIAESPCL